MPRIEDTSVPTIIVFNEAFFGQDMPLSKKEVNEIIEIYKKFQSLIPNAYLYINFLYTDIYTEENKKIYDPQIEISKIRYREIITNEGDKTLETIMQPSLIFGNRIQENIDSESFEQKVYIKDEYNYLEKSKEGIYYEQTLLFNQTKIFHKGEEIGYYNKSSFCNEIPDFLNKKLYYVIGDFNTKYLDEKQHLPIACLMNQEQH